MLARSGIVFVAVAAWVVGSVTRFCGPNNSCGPMSLLHLSLIGMPVELFLAGSSGRPYEHYYLTWLPLFAVLTAQFVSRVSRYLAPMEMSCFGHRVNAAAVWMVALLIPMLLQCALALFKPVTIAIQSGRSAVPNVVKRIWHYTSAQDYLLMWGAEVRYNFVAARTAPSRFVYQYPLYTCGYVTDAMVTEFANDIARHKPLIIDTSSTNPVVPPLSVAGRRKWGGQAFAGAKEDCKQSPHMAALFAFIDAHYRIAEVIQPEGWVILQYADDPKSSGRFGIERGFGGGLRPDGEAVGYRFERFHVLKPGFLVAHESGRRKSDLLALRWLDVDVENGLIRVGMKKTKARHRSPFPPPATRLFGSLAGARW